MKDLDRQSLVCDVHGNQRAFRHETHHFFKRAVTTMDNSIMSCFSLTVWPMTFTCGDFVRLRDAPARVGVIVRPGEQLDEWLIAFVDGERNVYLFEHVETFVPTSSERAALEAISER